MARAIRIEYENAFYHVTSRGNERKNIFFSKSDYEKFKEYEDSVMIGRVSLALVGVVYVINWIDVIFFSNKNRDNISMIEGNKYFTFDYNCKYIPEQNLYEDRFFIKFKKRF